MSRVGMQVPVFGQDGHEGGGGGRWPTGMSWRWWPIPTCWGSCSGWRGCWPWLCSAAGAAAAERAEVGQRAQVPQLVRVDHRGHRVDLAALGDVEREDADQPL